MSLTPAVGRVLPAGMVALKMALQRGCGCGGVAGTLRKRVESGASVRIELQCDCCGAMLGDFRRADHPHFLAYPLWDEGLAAAYRRRLEAASDEGAAAAKIAAQQGTLRQRAEYADWLRTSPEWRDLRIRVLRRANGVCEACSAAKAEHIHHETYAFGKIPPAYFLKAVCGSCHQRLHETCGDWGRANGR